MNLFLTGCIPVRIALVLVAAFATSPEILKGLAVVTGAIALGFAIIYVFGLRATGVETGGKPIWWNDLRPVHAALYAIAAIAAWNGRGDIAWKVLAADVVLGLWAYFVLKPLRETTSRGS